MLPSPAASSPLPLSSLLPPPPPTPGTSVPYVNTGHRIASWDQQHRLRQYRASHSKCVPRHAALVPSQRKLVPLDATSVPDIR
eukprot:3940537-Rhodomonas_salina.3